MLDSKCNPFKRVSVVDWRNENIKAIGMYYIFLFRKIQDFPGGAAAAAKSLQSCTTLCDPIDGSPPGSPIPGILQARILEWVATSFSNARK